MNREGRSRPLFTLHTDSRVIGIEKALGERETQAAPFKLSTEARIFLNERLEQLRQEFRIDAHAGVAKLKAELAFVSKLPHLDPTALGEFDCVTDQILQCGGNAILVGHDACPAGFIHKPDVDALPIRERTKIVDLSRDQI